MAESIIGLYKAELISLKGPWRTVEDVELATLGWVHWWNTTRIHTAIGKCATSRARSRSLRSTTPGHHGRRPLYRASTNPGAVQTWRAVIRRGH